MSSAPAAARSSLRGDFLINLFGNVGYAAAQWAMMLVLVRLGSPTMLGEYSLALAIGAPVVMFTNLRLANLLASDAGRSRPFADYFSVRLVANGIAYIAILLWATLGGYRGDVWIVIALVGLAKIAEAFSDLTFGYLTLRLRFRAVALSFGIRGWGTVVLMTVLRLAGQPLTVVAAGIAVWWWLAFWLVDLRLARAASIGDDPAVAPPSGVLALLAAFRVDPGLLRLAWQAVPLGVVALCQSLSASVPRLTIARELGADAVGYFSALAYVMVAGRMVAVALGTPTLPRLGAFFAAGDRAGFLRTVGAVLLFAVGLGTAGVVGSILLGEPALRLVYGPDYAAWASVLTLLLIASGLGFASNFLEDALIAMRHLAVQGVLMAMTLATTTIACTVFIPRFGLRGAAYAIIAGAAVEVTGAALLFLRAMRHWSVASRPAPSPHP